MTVHRPARSRIVVAAAGPLVAILSLLALTAPARAHDPAGYYNGAKWPMNVITNEPYWIASGVPVLGNVEAAIVAGANQWNWFQTRVRFAHQGWSTQSFIRFPNCPGNTHSYVFQENIDYIGSQYGGYTWTCQQGGIVNSFVVFFDQRSWYSGTGTPPVNAPDRWSYSSHEFGHATGFSGHWPTTSTRCQNNANRLTMCAELPNGTTMMRDLGDHDYHTFQAAYP